MHILLLTQFSVFKLFTFFFVIRVHKLFLYDEVVKKPAKFNFGQLISHKNPKTGKRGMKVIEGDAK